MKILRPSAERGPTKIQWLDSKHSFSFGHYHDPRRRGFRNLLVINEDRVVPGAGFGEHGHEDMEILSYVVEGALVHRDSIGTGSTIRPGEIQRMSAGHGIRHSEFNGSKVEPVHFLQIWIAPQVGGLDPSYEQKAMPPIEEPAQLDVIASPEGGGTAVTLHQDARIFRASLQPDRDLTVPLDPHRHAWVQVVRGEARLDELDIAAGDGVAISNEQDFILRGRGAERAELLIFDLA